MSAKLAGRIAVITGGGSGMGAAGCELFAANGARVVVADIDFEAASAVSEGIRHNGGVPSRSRAMSLESLNCARCSRMWSRPSGV